VERIVSDTIAAQLDVRAEVLPLSTAQKIPGLRAVFGEEYPDPVRVISLLSKVGKSWCYLCELC
jgi:alanyl-tRNA synthetase